MYAAERRRQILDIIHDEASVKVVDLAEMFQVSPSTIRRDLNELHKADLLERTYGGAVTAILQETEASFSERSISRQSEKDRIGRAAARLIKPGESIIIDGGTTTECMARYLPEVSPLTVVTFGLNIIKTLAGQEKLMVIGVGGMLDHRSLTFGGVLAVDALQTYNIRFDKAFIAASGISAEGGVTNVGFEEIPMKRKAIELSREVILLADSSKVGVNAVGFVVPAAKLHRLITDSAAPPEEVAELRQAGVVIELV